VAGAIKRPLEAHRGWGNPFSVLAYSGALGDTPFALHANIGWTRSRATRSGATPWAIAIEYAPTERSAIVAETFGLDRERPFVRVGARHALIPKRLDLDIAFVARPAGTREERFVSVGVSWQSGAAAP